MSSSQATVSAGVVSVLVSLYERMSEGMQAFEEFQGELEDYLLSQNAGFLA
jgi:hypothetical protein